MPKPLCSHNPEDDDRRTNLTTEEAARIHTVVMSLDVCSMCERVSECADVFVPNQGALLLCVQCRAQIGARAW